MTFSRKPDEVAQGLPVTRCGPASELVQTLSAGSNLSDGRSALFDALESDEDLFEGLYKSAMVTSALWAGLWALENGVEVILPTTKDHPSFSLLWSAS